MIAQGFLALAATEDAEPGERETPVDELLGVATALERYDVGRRALLAAVDRHELTVVRGARQKLLVSRLELERWLRSRPVQPRQRHAQGAEVVELEAYERDAMADLARARRVR
ncbi:MAG TPA: hypothetical protein VMI54_03840 [Polyangiaceae bacterium]|nr:hypothetical protein [Polyangiaceae bacterium]